MSLLKETETTQYPRLEKDVIQLMQISIDNKVDRIDVHLADVRDDETKAETKTKTMLVDNNANFNFVLVETNATTLCHAVQLLTSKTRGEERKIVLSKLKLVSCTGFCGVDDNTTVTWRADETIADFLLRNSALECFQMDFETPG